ncbi:MAG TPA: hypothetical protein VMM80_10430 [Bacteroidota bacterium]|nr:hypothetical protein [Bacteroidota bacterium]
MRSIWGSSASDVYVGGHADPPGSPLYHFDGARWLPVALTSVGGGTVEISQVFGFSAMDIVAVGGIMSGPGETSLILHFDGNSWSAMSTPPGGKLNAVWGVPAGEMWAAGAPGTMFHYMSLVWLSALVPDSSTCSSIAGISNDDVYALMVGRGRGPADTVYHALWHWNGGVWAVADTFDQAPGRPDRFGTRSVWSLLAVLYTVGDGLFVKDASGWNTLVPAPGDGSFNAVNGAVNSSLFLVGDRSALFQVGPTDFYRYSRFTDPSISFTGAWTNQREAFIVGNDGRATYILHGK